MNAEDVNDVSHDHAPEVGWGTPAQPNPPEASTPQQPTPQPSGPTGWSLLRQALFWSVLVLGVVGIGVGLYAIAEDMSDTTDAWHGFGIAIGTILAVPGLVLCLLAGFGLRSMRRCGPSGGRVHAVVIGFLLLGVLVLGSLSPVLLLPVVPGALLLLTVFADQGDRPRLRP